MPAPCAAMLCPAAALRLALPCSALRLPCSDPRGFAPCRCSDALTSAPAMAASRLRTSGRSRPT
eukprot:2934751-Prymnesium_polylepis.1